MRPSPLADLTERLRLNGAEVDPARVGTALLGLAYANDWLNNPKQFVEWMTALAADLGRGNERDK